MTRIRKLFLGIFLMVFALGIGVFIFVQVDSKDAGTGKSRPLSMAEKIMKYDDALNAYIEANYDEWLKFAKEENAKRVVEIPNTERIAILEQAVKDIGEVIGND